MLFFEGIVFEADVAHVSDLINASDSTSVVV